MNLRHYSLSISQIRPIEVRTDHTSLEVPNKQLVEILCRSDMCQNYISLLMGSDLE